jgi:hypothetical protein
LGKTLDNEEKASMNKVGACVRRGQRVCFLSLCVLMFEDTRRSGSSANQIARLQKQFGCWYLDLGLPSLQMLRNKYLLFKQTSLWQFVIVARAN